MDYGLAALGPKADFRIFGSAPSLAWASTFGQTAIQSSRSEAGHELIAAFLVAFDVLVRRVRKTVNRWERAARQFFQIERLVCPPNAMRGISPNERHSRDVVAHQRGLLFSYATRFHLRRRAWRYFRRLGYANPAGYPRAIANALFRYQDSNLASGETILDSWCLLQICFHGNQALEFTPDHVRIKEGHSLVELTPAPYFPETWKSPDSAALLLKICTKAQAQVVRKWAMLLLRDIYKDVSLALSPEELTELLNHLDEDIQRLGAELLSALPGLEIQPLSFWLKLMQTQNLESLTLLCNLFTKYVSRDRLTVEQLLSLATSRAAPVARIGLKFLTEQKTWVDAELPELARLAHAQSEAVAGDIAKWATQQLGTPERYTIGNLIRFFDSRTATVREAAWDWLVSDSPGYNDPVLWSRITETPYEDLRLRLVDHLSSRTSQRHGKGNDDLTLLWTSTLLGVHRGGRQKLKATEQIADAIIKHPTRATALIPVLAVAVRSIRGPEARAGLAAVMRIVIRRPEIASQVQRDIPELQCDGAQAVL